MKKVLLVAVAVLMILPLAFSTGKLKMGFTIEDFNDVFMRYALDQLKDEAAKNNIDIVAEDGKRDPNQQIQQVENFITQGKNLPFVAVGSDPSSLGFG